MEISTLNIIIIIIIIIIKKIYFTIHVPVVFFTETKGHIEK